MENKLRQERREEERRHDREEERRHERDERAEEDQEEKVIQPVLSINQFFDFQEENNEDLLDYFIAEPDISEELRDMQCYSRSSCGT